MRPMNSLLNWSLNMADVVARIVVLAPPVWAFKVALRAWRKARML